MSDKTSRQSAPGLFQLLEQAKAEIERSTDRLYITWRNPHWTEESRLHEISASSWSAGCDGRWLHQDAMRHLAAWALDFFPRPFVIGLNTEEARWLRTSLEQYGNDRQRERAAVLAGGVPRGWLCTVAGIHVVEWPVYVAPTDEQRAILDTISDAQIEAYLARRRASAGGK